MSAHAFDGVDARLSRYSYLVSLLPRRIIDDLGAQVRLARRRYSSYTPDPADRRPHRAAGRAPAVDFDAIGAGADEAGFDEFYRRCRAVTQRLWPTLTAAAAHRADARAHVLAGGDPTPTPRGESMIDAADRRRDHRRRRQRPGARRDGDRRADRHVRPHRRPVAGAERLLPLPPARRRHRRLGRADRRHGRGQRRAGGRRVAATAPKSSPAQRFTRSTRTARCATAATAASTVVHARLRAGRRHARRCWPACSANPRPPRRPARR